MINNNLVGGWALPLWKILEKSSVGMMKFPIWWEKESKCSKPPISDSIPISEKPSVCGFSTLILLWKNPVLSSNVFGSVGHSCCESVWFSRMSPGCIWVIWIINTYKWGACPSGTILKAFDLDHLIDRTCFSWRLQHVLTNQIAKRCQWLGLEGPYNACHMYTVHRNNSNPIKQETIHGPLKLIEMKLDITNDSVGRTHHFHAIHSQRAARAFRSFHPWRLGFVSTAVQTHRHRGRNAIRHDASASLVPYPESDFGNTTCSSWTWQAAFFVGFNVASLETRLTQSSFSIIPVAGCFPQGPRRGMAIEIVSFPTKNGDVPVRYVKIPEGNSPDCYPINCPMVIP